MQNPLWSLYIYLVKKIENLDPMTKDTNDLKIRSKTIYDL